MQSEISDSARLGTDKETWRMIRDHPIFQDVTDDEVTATLNFLRPVYLKPGQVVIEEGDQLSMDLFFILEGNLEVIKKAEGKGSGGQEELEQFIIAKLSAGDVIGELSFIKGGPRSASIQCIKSSTLLALDPKHLKMLEVEYPRVFGLMMKNLAGYVAGRLRQTSFNEVRALKTELENSIMNSKANLFFSYVIGLLCIYNLTISKITSLSLDSSRASVISALIIIVFCLGLILMIRQSKLPVRVLGLTMLNWKVAVQESVIWTVIIVAGLVSTKWILISIVPRYQHLPLFDFDLTQQYLGANFILYGLHSPIQEFVARGVLQGSLQHFFSGKNVTVRAVIVSNALFSATHVHLMDGMLAAIVFVPGLFWGWLYARHNSLLGVSISHLAIGWTSLFFLNLESLF